MMDSKQKKNLTRIIVAFALLVLAHFLGEILAGRIGTADEGASGFSDPVRWLLFAMYLVPYIIIGYDILKKAVRGIVNRQPLDENLLMATATIGAFALALYRTGDYDEAVAVMLFYQVGEFFQSYALGRSRKNIGELMDVRPDYANVPTEGGVEKVDPDEVEIGSIIIVGKGEKVPIDGIVEDGESSIDTSALTGESLPRLLKKGDEILSGCINMGDTLTVRTTSEFGESTASKILDLVENASSRKSKSEQFISRFARVYTPVVAISALLLALLPPIVRMAGGLDADFGEWVYRALTFLVISCPCALVISIPLSFFAGIGGASRQGILVKGSNYLERLSGIRAIAMDKTGTLTRATFEDGILMGEEIKETSAKAISSLRKAGVSRIVMLSGDRKENAEKVAGKLGIDEVYSELLPAGKVEKLEEIMGDGSDTGERNRNLVAFAGDGINDAPVLSRADLGIAMGALGSDAAIEAADIVLMDDDPLKIARAIEISSKCMRIVRENIVFAIGVKVLCLLLCAIGLAGMWLAIFADVGVMVLAVLNAIRALYVSKEKEG